MNNPIAHWLENPKLTDEQVRRIRELRFEGSTTIELARHFDVSRQHIYRIITGQERRFVGGPIFGPYAAKPTPRPRSCDGPQPITWKVAS